MRGRFGRQGQAHEQGSARARAGFGAVREAVEVVLRHNRRWERILEKYEVIP